MRFNYAGMKISGLEITRNKTTCCQVTTSMQLQNRSFQVVHWNRTAAKCAKLKNARATRAKLSFSSLNMQICDVLVSLFAMVTTVNIPKDFKTPKGNYATDNPSSVFRASNL